MRRIAPLVFSMIAAASASFGALACAGAARADAAAAPPPPPVEAAAPASAGVRERVDRGARGLFAAERVEGVFVLRSLDRDEQIVTDGVAAGERELPASTFKVPAALIALERGVLDGADATIAWDGVARQVPQWNRDHTLASALRDSAVWFFQEVARRVGEAGMRASLESFGYGNADVGGGVDRFWLDGALRISPREQVEFMSRLHRRTLPVARRNMELVEHMITRAQAPGWSWRGKTGVIESGDRVVGWLVGLAERDGRTWAYALMVRGPVAEESRLIEMRPRLARALLIHFGALPEGAAG